MTTPTPTPTEAMLAITNELSNQRRTGRIAGYSLSHRPHKTVAEATIDLHAGGVRHEVFQLTQWVDIQQIRKMIEDRITILVMQ